MDLLGILRIKDSNGNWVSVPGLKGDTGEPFKILGIYATAAALEAAVTDPEVGDVYLVGTTGAYDIYLYLADGWHNTGRYMPKGDQGDPAPAASITSAVETWLAANVDPETGYVLDRTLSIETAAAPADLVGNFKNNLDEIDADLYGSQIEITYTPNEYVDTDGSFKSFNGWSRSNFIPVPTDGDGLIYTNTGRASASCAFYSEANVSSFIRTFPIQQTQMGNFPLPVGAKYFVYSNYTADMDLFTYVNPPTASSGLIEEVNGLDDRVTALESSPHGNIPEIVLPPYGVAVIGHEFNMYTENVVICKNMNDYIWAWDMRPYYTQYNQYDDRFSVIPAANSERTYTLSLTCMDKITGETITSASMSLIVVPDSTLTGKKMLMIGDSLTAAGYSAYEISAVLSGGGVESLGTIAANPWIGNVQRPITMEGRGGWSAYDYMHTSSKNGSTNAFLNPSTNLFDFTYYMTQQGYSDVDIVLLNLGTNAVDNIQRDIEAMGQIIASIHSYDPNLPVVVHLTPPPATQSGWTYINHGAGAEKFRLKTLAMVKAAITAFGNKQSEHTYISCTYGCLDRYHDFTYREEAISQRNPFTATRQLNNVHPSSYGYYKFADVYWGMIQYLLS